MGSTLEVLSLRCSTTSRVEVPELLVLGPVPHKTEATSTNSNNTAIRILRNKCFAKEDT